MANTIKFKRGSGSDPSASDLVVGELAVRTDEGKLFTKKDDGTVAEISGGGIDDGDKGDITVSNSGATFTIDSGVIDNANVASNAAIDGSKINPDFGSQNLVIADKIIHSGDTNTAIRFAGNDQFSVETGGTTRFTITDTQIQHSLNTQIAGSFTMSHTNADFAVNDAAGTNVFTVNSNTGNTASFGNLTLKNQAALRLSEGSSNGSNYIELKAPSALTDNYTFTFPNTNPNNLGSGGGLLRTSTSGQLSWDTTNFLESGESINITSGSTFINFGQGNKIKFDSDNSNTYEITFVAPNTLTKDSDFTLPEDGSSGQFLTTDGSGALSFATVTNVTGNSATATKLATARTIAGVSFDGSANISLNNNAITNGAGYITGSSLNASNLSSGTIPDARIPDVITPATLVSTIELRTSNGQQLVLNAGESAGKVSGQTGEYVYANAEGGLSVNTPDSANPNWVGGSASDQTLITGTAITIDGNTVFHQGNDGAGSGLDADTVDGIQGASFLRSDTADTMTGNLSMNGNVILDTGHVVQHHTTATRDKYRVWNSSTYVIGMDNGMSFGGLNDYAMTFQMNSDDDRGFVFLDSSHTDSQGAMSLTTNGKMCVAHSLRVGYGESDTTTPGATYRLDVSGDVQADGDVTIGDGSADTRVIIKKADNNEADHIQFFLGSTRMGEIGSLDTTWLRINQETAKNIYTPRIIRADGGFQVDGLTVINGSGSYVRALSGASDYSSLLRSDTADTASGDITFSGGAGAATIAANSDIRFTTGTWTGNTTAAKIQLHNNVLYISHGSSGLIFRENTANRWLIDGSGHFRPASDSTYDLGSTSVKVRVGYFDELDSAEVRVNNGIIETKAAIAASHSLTADYNGFSVSPTINSGVTVTVPSGAVFAIV